MPPPALVEEAGGQTDLAAAVRLAVGLFPPGRGRRLVLLTDGMETRGDLLAAAREAALAGVRLEAAPNAGEARPDVRVLRLEPSRSRLHEGAVLRLTATVESSLAGSGRLRLFVNGFAVESRPLTVAPGETKTVVFEQTPDQRNVYRFRVRAEGFPDDALPENNAALALVEVLGPPVLLYIEGDREEAEHLAGAMQEQGLRLVVRPPEGIPDRLPGLAGFDGLILSDVPAQRLTARQMAVIRDYVEDLGGGFVMIGGRNSFGVGGYYRTPIEDILPVKMKARDPEERYSVALALVLDRSGSMSGQKIELCKSAAIATAEMLSPRDWMGVVAFDSQAHWVVPMVRAGKGTVSAQVAGLTAGGGTNIQPGMLAAREALAGVQARVKHMIVLTDGHTGGSGYPQLAAQLQAEGVTVSTVAVGQGADAALLQSIAQAGGGDFHMTTDPSNLTRIFTQDAMVHAGRLLREEPFAPRRAEHHPMLSGWEPETVPELLGYVKTRRKATAQTLLVTDLDEPLLAHWRFGLGRVTAFTSDCKSRWAALWLARWPGYGTFWAQVLRETARDPQSHRLDLQLRQEAGKTRMIVDALEDAGSWRQGGALSAEVYFLPAHALGGALQARSAHTLEQSGPGRYEGAFRPREPGVYLVRARAGAETVSAGLVHNPSSEAATGQVNRPLLAEACAVSGGELLAEDAEALPDRPARQDRYSELAPLFLQLLLVLLLADLAVRRWENLLGVGDALARLLGRGEAG
jgi:uncharacterized membrane protein